MGFNSTLIVLNDGLHAIEQDKEYGAKVAAAIQRLSVWSGPVDICSGGHVNASSVVETHHADSLKLIVVGGNCAQDLGYVGNWRTEVTAESIMRELADRLGYRVAKKPKCSVK